MNDGATTNQMEHPVDVMRAALAMNEKEEPFALSILTASEGGAVRSPGALMAIGKSGETFGYLSGGCVEQDIKLKAVEAIEANSTLDIRYGAGSPFVDIRLPCGGAIDLTIIPNPDESVLRIAISDLDQGKCTSLKISGNRLTTAKSCEQRKYIFTYRPKLNLRIAGKGLEVIMLAKLADSAGISCEVWTPDRSCIQNLQSLETCSTKLLDGYSQLPQLIDSRETAFVLMFHDVHWELPLLRQALQGNAFYIGAVGSKNTHKKRCVNLLEAGVHSSDIARIRGPIGLVPSMRDASMLSISILAEIVQAFHFEEKAAS